MRLTVLWMALAVAVVGARAEPLDDAVERYRTFMIEDIGQALSGVRTMRDRIAANDVPGAQKAWINARVGWERSEVFTSGFVPQLDEAIDAWPDGSTGFHAIEAKLFANPSVVRDETDVRDKADALIRNLAGLDAQIRTMTLTPQGLLNGVVRLAYEVGDSKVDGGESRFSGTSLDDMRNNIDGVELTYRTLFASSLEAADAKLAERVQSKIGQIKLLLEARDLKKINPDELRKASEVLVVTLQVAGPKIGLATPTLEEAAK